MLAQLDGQTVGGRFRFPNTATVVRDLEARVVGPGLESTFVAQAEADVGDASTLCRGIPGTGPAAWLPGVFDGFRVYDVGGTLPNFFSVTLNPATNLPGFDLSRVIWNADEVLLNVQRLVQLPARSSRPTSASARPATFPSPRRARSWRPACSASRRRHALDVGGEARPAGSGKSEGGSGRQFHFPPPASRFPLVTT